MNRGRGGYTRGVHARAPALAHSWSSTTATAGKGKNRRFASRMSRKWTFRARFRDAFSPRTRRRHHRSRRHRTSRAMCRWIYYYGDEVCISKLIYGASHGLATMADRAGWTPGCARDAERNHEVNVHGCGA